MRGMGFGALTLGEAHTTLGRLVDLQQEVRGLADDVLTQTLEEVTAKLMGDGPVTSETALFRAVLHAEFRRRVQNHATF